MGLIEKLKGELVDIIEWMDDSRSTLAWRFPRYHNEIKNGAQLIVREGQRAVFVYKGKLADKFDPGSYELTTENLPLLSTLQGWKHGFKSPFRSEVYFINTRPVTDLRWGTPQPVTIRDPDFRMVQIRANGLCVVKIEDRTKSQTALTVVLHEGKKRQIRRVFDSIGHRVMELERFQYGTLSLGDIKTGQKRRLTSAEVESLKMATGLVPSKKARG